MTALDADDLVRGDIELLEVRRGARAPGWRLALPSRAIVQQRLASVAALGVWSCMLVIAVLHVLPSGRTLSPLSAPISDYALTSTGWLFNAAVLVLAVGLAALLCALVVGGWLAASSGSFAVIVVCCLSLVTLVVFPYHTSGGVLTDGGWVHWAASMVAFAGMPVAAVLLGRRHKLRAGCPGLPSPICWLSLAAGACFAVYFVGGVVELATPVRFWPLGGVIERTLAATEMLTAVVLATQARSSCQCDRDAYRELLRGPRVVCSDQEDEGILVNVARRGSDR